MIFYFIDIFFLHDPIKHLREDFSSYFFFFLFNFLYLVLCKLVSDKMYILCDLIVILICLCLPIVFQNLFMHILTLLKYMVIYFQVCHFSLSKFSFLLIINVRIVSMNIMTITISLKKQIKRNLKAINTVVL